MVTIPWVLLLMHLVNSHIALSAFPHTPVFTRIYLTFPPRFTS